MTLGICGSINRLRDFISGLSGRVRKELGATSYTFD